MQTRDSRSSSAVNAEERKGDYVKLVSLLALATGAVAMPQTGRADIIYTDLNSTPAQVGFAGGFSGFYLFDGLRGDIQFGFQAHQHTAYTYTGLGGSIEYRTITVGRIGSVGGGVQAAPNGFVVPLNNGAPWNQPFGLFYSANVGRATTLAHAPTSSYDHKYLAFAFADTSQGGALRYGWIELSLQIANILGGGTGPNVTIWGYAFADDGSKPAMGQLPVPEPSSAVLLAFGALAFGARGVRSWRRNRSVSDQRS